MEHVMGVIAEEGKAIARAQIINKCGYRILEAAGLADNRNGTVTQRDHLCQTARLGLRRHQEHIGTGINLIGQLAREQNGHRNLIRMTALGLEEHLLIPPVALAQHDQSYIVLQDIVQHSFDQIQTLLVGQSANHADNRRILVAFQSAQRQQIGLIFLLSCHTTRGIVLGKCRIGCRIERRHIDTVHVKTYEAIIKGDNIPEPGIPESFKVLLKELQSLGLDVRVLSEDGSEVHIMETSDYGDTDLRHVIEGDSRGRRDEESFGKHGYTKQEFSGEELVNVEEDEDMEDEDDMIEFEESFDDEE